jgi:hypothetical protein
MKEHPRTLSACENSHHGIGFFLQRPFGEYSGEITRADVLLEFHGRIYRRFVSELKRYSKAHEIQPDKSARKTIENLAVASTRNLEEPPRRIALAVNSLRRRPLGSALAE